MSRRVSMAEVSGRRGWGRPRLAWIDGVKMFFQTVVLFLNFVESLNSILFS